MASSRRWRRHSRPPWPRCARRARASSTFRCASSQSCREINAKGGLSAAESYAIHRALIARAEKLYDPRVLVRILRGREQDAADYIDLLDARADFIRRVAAVTAPYDALVHADHGRSIAPRIADLAADDAYRHANMLVLRNPSIANFLDRCSISIPCHRAGDAPVGLMLIGEHGADRRLLSIAAAIEEVVSPDARRSQPAHRCRADEWHARSPSPAGDAAGEGGLRWGTGRRSPAFDRPVRPIPSLPASRGEWRDAKPIDRLHGTRSMRRAIRRTSRAASAWISR